jgi:hypothetical protein
MTSRNHLLWLQIKPLNFESIWVSRGTAFELEGRSHWLSG